jgi:flotillin
MNTETILWIAAPIFGAIGIVALCNFCYKRCPSDRVLVIYSMTSRSQSFRCIHGKPAFVWPVIQHNQFLDLTPIPLKVNLEGVRDKNSIDVDLFSTLTVGISTTPGVVENAAERLLGVKLGEVQELAANIIYDRMRAAISSMDILAMKDDRDSLIEKIVGHVEPGLTKVGLRLINVNISDVQFRTT